MTIKGQNIINRAHLIIFAGSLVPGELFRHCASEEIIDSSGLTLEQTHNLMSEACRGGKLVARVHTGDPSIFGTIHEQTALLKKDGIPFEIVPGVTAAFAAAARADISFTLPGVNQTLIITRAPGRTAVPSSQNLKKLAASRSSMAIYLSAAHAGSVQSELMDGGFEESTTVILGWKVGWKDELVVTTSLDRLARTVSEMGIKGQVVFLILPGPGDAPRSKLYDPGFSHGFRKNDHD